MSAARWGAACDSCDFIISVDGDGKPVPDPAEWDAFSACPVCGSSVSFDEQGETQWNRETRLMHNAAKNVATKALREAADAVEDDCTHSTERCFCGSSEWLRERADRIEAAS